jgi:WD40 repeat protein
MGGLRSRGKGALFVLLLLGAGVRAQEGEEGNLSWIFQGPAGGHRGKVSSILYDGRWILSAGEDGFLGIWDPQEGRAAARFQLSRLPILSIVLRPGKNQIACIEDEGLGRYRVSAWDYLSLKNLFTLRFQDPVRSLSYSAGGNYLAVSRSGDAALALLNPETGEDLLEPRNIPGEFPPSASFTAIGRTERVILVYSGSGTLSYWELKKDGEMRLEPALDDFALPLSFDVPGNLSSPLLFGNNRFFAGFDGGGLALFQADTGYELDRSPFLPWGKLAAWGDELYCLTVSGDSPDGRAFSGRDGIYRFRVGDSGRLEWAGFYPSPAEEGPCAFALIPREDSPPLIVTGSRRGLLSLESFTGPLETEEQLPITAAAAGEEGIAFITGDRRLGFIPLDFHKLEDGMFLGLENAGDYSRITAAGAAFSFREGKRADRFILWQDGSPQPQPQLRSPGAEISLPLPGNSPGRNFPLRSVSVLGDRGLFLDAGGNVSVIALEDGGALYAENSAGAVDAAFIDQDSIILGRSSGEPFLMIDTGTRETVPVPYPASIGIRVYRGPSGRVYGAAVEETAEGLRTSIIRIEPRNPSGPARLMEYQGGDTALSIAETGGYMASTLGGAGVYSPWGGLAGLERGPALPLQITEGGSYFIVLDGEGCVSWHDPGTGKILALFRLYRGSWALSAPGIPPLGGRASRFPAY